MKTIYKCIVNGQIKLSAMNRLCGAIRLRTGAGWQSGRLHSELVLNLKYIRVYSPRGHDGGLTSKLQPEAHAPAQPLLIFYPQA